MLVSAAMDTAAGWPDRPLGEDAQTGSVACIPCRCSIVRWCSRVVSQTLLNSLIRPVLHLIQIMVVYRRSSQSQKPEAKIVLNRRLPYVIVTISIALLPQAISGCQMAYLFNHVSGNRRILDRMPECQTVV